MARGPWAPWGNEALCGGCAVGERYHSESFLASGAESFLNGRPGGHCGELCPGFPGTARRLRTFIRIKGSVKGLDGW